MFRSTHTARRINSIMVVGLLFTLLAMPVVADEDVNQTVDAKSNSLVLVENIAGSIEIIGWDRDEIKVEGTLRGDAEKVIVEGGKKAKIKVKYPRKQRNLKGGADLVIHVPSGGRVSVECISADISVEGVTGKVSAESISGSVDITGDCEEVDIESISGRVTVNSSASEISMNSISGKIIATGAVAEVRAESVNGTVDLTFDKFLALSAGSVSGDASISGDLDADGSFKIELHSGTLELTVPADIDADFQIVTFSGGIDNGFGQKSHKTSKYAPGRELEFTNGSGDARVQIDTFSGDVIIRKK